MDWPTLPENPYIDNRAPGDARVCGTRVQLEIVVEEFNNGREPEDIAGNYPTLSLEAVYGTITYYLAHRDLIDRYVALVTERDEALEREHDRQPDPPVVARIKALRAAKHQA